MNNSMERNTDCNANRNMGRNMNCNMNRGMNRNTGCNMNREMNRNTDCNMNREMNRNTNCNMNRSMSENANCNMNRNEMNCRMTRNTNDGRMNHQGRNNMVQNRQGCGCGNNNMSRSNTMGRSNSMNRSNAGCECDHRGREKDGFMKMAGCHVGSGATNREPVDDMAPGMAFVPWQKWEDIYCMEKALERGTIFEQLDKPFLGGRMK